MVRADAAFVGVADGELMKELVYEREWKTSATYEAGLVPVDGGLVTAGAPVPVPELVFPAVGVEAGVLVSVTP